MTPYDANADEIPEYCWDGRLDPDERWISVSGGDLPCDIEIRLGEPRSGRFVCTGLRVGARDGDEEYEVTSRMLRDIRLGNVLRAFREGFGCLASQSLARVLFSGTLVPGAKPARLTVADALAEKARGLNVRRGRKGLDPETLLRTAETYQEVLSEAATQPLAVTAQRLDIHPSTVWRRLQNAWKRFPELDPRRRES